MKTQAEIEEWLRNPPPGSKAAAARDFGIDLTLTIENLRLTPQQRLERLEGKLAFARQIRAGLQRARSNERVRTAA